jgi:hypothetical protein
MRQLRICQDDCGTWRVHGLSPIPVSHLSSLSASVDYARKACDAAPATIELFVDGMYILVHQEQGWPRTLFARCTDRAGTAETEPDLRGSHTRSRFFAWLQRFSLDYHRDASIERGASRAIS